MRYDGTPFGYYFILGSLSELNQSFRDIYFVPTSTVRFLFAVVCIVLVLQISLLGMQAKGRIQQGDSTIEVMIWLLNQCFPVLERAKRLEDENKKGDRN